MICRLAFQFNTHTWIRAQVARAEPKMLRLQLREHHGRSPLRLPLVAGI